MGGDGEGCGEKGLGKAVLRVWAALGGGARWLLPAFLGCGGRAGAMSWCCALRSYPPCPSTSISQPWVASSIPYSWVLHLPFLWLSRLRSRCPSQVH